MITYLPQRRRRNRRSCQFGIIVLLILNLIVWVVQLKELKKQSDELSVKIEMLTKAVGEMETSVKTMALISAETQEMDKQVYLELSKLCKIFASVLNQEVESKKE